MFETYSTGLGLDPVQQISMPSASGIVYYDGQAQQFKIVDPVNPHSSVSVYPINHMLKLDGSVETMLNWVQAKMLEEQRLKDLIQDNAAAKEAYDHLQLLLTLSK